MNAEHQTVLVRSADGTSKELLLSRVVGSVAYVCPLDQGVSRDDSEVGVPLKDVTFTKQKNRAST